LIIEADAAKVEDAAASPQLDFRFAPIGIKDRVNYG